MKIGSSPFVLVVESLSRKTGVCANLSHIPTFVISYFCYSLARNSAPGFSSVSSRRNTAIWALTKRVIIAFPPTNRENTENYQQLGCGGLQEQITFQGLDPQCKLSIIFFHIPR